MDCKKHYLLSTLATVLIASSAQASANECVLLPTSAGYTSSAAKPETCLSNEDAFLLAVTENNLAQAQRFFYQGVDVNYRTSNRHLIKAVNVRADKLNRYVVGRGRYQYGSGTAYDIALTNGNPQMVRWLLQNKANPAAGFFRQHIERTNFSNDYPASYLSLPYAERSKIISTGIVLEAAVEENDYETVTKLLQIEPRAVHYGKNKLLPRIIRLGKWKVAEAFIRHGKDLDKLHGYVPTLSELVVSEPTNYRMLEMFLRGVHQSKRLDFFPLFKQALNKKDKVAMKMLVKYGTNINVKDKKPPLFQMAEEENIDMVKFLLELRADPNLRYSGQYLIHRAIANKNMPLALALISKKANVNVVDTQSRTPLQIAMYKTDDRFAQLLINNGANVHVKDGRQNNLQHIAASEGKTRITKMLIAKGASVQHRNNADETPLLLAINEGHLETAKALVAAGANVNIKDRYDRSPLGSALSKKTLAYVKLLLSKNVNVNKLPDSSYPLITAVEQVNIPLLKLLLKSGAKADATRTHSKNTALHIAVNKANLEMMTLLLDAGVDVNKLNSSKVTALHLASEKTHKRMVQLLLKYKPKMNGMTSNSQTPLHLAVIKGNLEISQMLLNAGAVPNTVDIYGNSPLLEALNRRKTRIAEVLIKKGAKVNVANNQRQTPLDIALAKGLRHIATVMRNMGAQTGLELGAAGSLRVELITKQPLK